MKSLNRVSEYLKYQGFWAMDAIRGSKIRTHLKDIKRILETKNSQQAEAMRKKLLENVLHHALLELTTMDRHV